MGRYYYGDIEGKFWFGVQDSTDASFFGGEEEEVYDTDEDGNTDYDTEMGMSYSFFPQHEGDLKDGIRECEDNLGSWLPKLEEFFERAQGYNDEILAQAIGADTSDVREMLAWYARLELGRQILKCLQETGQCCFTADYY